MAFKVDRANELMADDVLLTDERSITDLLTIRSALPTYRRDSFIVVSVANGSQFT